MTLAETLAGRWKWNAEGRLAPAKRTVDRALTLMEAVRARRSKISTDANLTPTGQVDSMRKFIAGDDVARHLHHARRSVENMRSQIEDWRKRLEPAAPDKTDSASAVLRSEMRAVLRDLNQGERMKALFADDADPRLLQAALEGLNVMSGITSDLREKIIATVTERTHPEDVRAIKEAEEALELVDVSVRVAFEEVRSAGGFDSDQALESFIAESLGQRTPAIDDHARQGFATFGAAA